MNKVNFFCLMITLLAMLSACTMFESSPQKIFKTVGLRSNKIPKNFKRAFDEIRGQKRNGTLEVVKDDGSVQRASAVSYVKTYYAGMLLKDMAKIEALSTNQETKPIIESGLDMFQYAHEIFNTDYVRIATLIDEDVPDDMIDKEIENLEKTKGVKLDEKYFKVMDLLLPYAEKYGVEYGTINMPFKTRR